MTWSGLRVSMRRPRWNKEASSIQCNTCTWKPLLPLQKKPSIPIMSLNSLASWSLAGRRVFRLTDSAHASQTYSKAASIMCDGEFKDLRCSASTLGSGWPRLLWTRARSCFSMLDKFRNLGPWIDTGGGAHPSHTSGGCKLLGTLGLWFSADGTILWGSLGSGKAISDPCAESLKWPKLEIISLQGMHTLTTGQWTPLLSGKLFDLSWNSMKAHGMSMIV